MNKDSTNLTVLVAGASGFLGSELVKQLLSDENINVIAMTSQKEKFKKKFIDKENLKVIPIDDWKTEIGKDLKIDILVNCAFPRTSEPEKLANAILFTEELIKDSGDLNIESIINISSQSVYSQKEKSNVNEQSAVIPESFYGMTKYACERIVASLCENSNITYSNIRLASLTGFDLEVRMTNRFVKSAIKGIPIVINGGAQKISYLDVRDAASALISMLKTNPRSWDKVYNLGNHHCFTVLELAETVREKAKDYSINEVKLEIHEGQDNFNNLMNNELFYDAFNWKPHYTMPLMVQELFKHYKRVI